MTDNPFEKFAVPAENVADFLARYYRPERYTGRGNNYARGLLRAYEAQFAQMGYTYISHHDSITGRVVAYFGR